MREVAEAAGVCWGRLTKDLKEPYEQKAREEKQTYSGHGTRERYTSSGNLCYLTTSPARDLACELLPDLLILKALLTHAEDEN